MGNKLVVANLKMNMTISEVSSYLKVINKEINTNHVVICPTSIYIPYFLKQGYKVGIQNTFYESEGAFTGEVSPMQASLMGVRYTIIGHSERRINFKENDLMINKKIKEAIKYNLRVILCIGETQEEKDLLKTNRVLKRQIINALREIDFDMLPNVIIAYEPVWAIGSNKTPSNKDINDTVLFIKDIVKNHFNYDDMKVLYGGSINAKNIKTLNKIESVNGYLVGGSSLDPKKFLSIIEVAVKE